MAHFPAERHIVRRQIENRLKVIHDTFYLFRKPIDGWETAVGGTEQDVAAPPTEGWKPIAVGSNWGGPDLTQWFRTSVTVPDEMAGRPVVAILNTGGGEGQCYVNGEPHQGLDANRWPVMLTQNATAGETFDLMVEAYTKVDKLPLVETSLAAWNELAWSVYWDFQVALEVAMMHDDGTAPNVQILDLVDRWIKRIDLNRTGDYEYYQKTLEEVQAGFNKGLDKFRNSSGFGELSMVSQSHIDVAWMWRLRETRRKVGRTFSTVLNYMDRYPDITFMQSQPQLYEYLKDHYPTLWERVKERVKEGRWHVIGAGWVEQDTNVPSGEAHVRQFLYGNRFYRKEFGRHTRILWLPDCFGFTFSMPQILKKAQVDYFGTWKLPWNEYNQPAYHYFRWKGIDGTEVSAFCLPTLVGGNPSPRETRRHWDAFLQKDLTDELPHAFGHGDGGGGPTPEMYEYVRRQENIVGMPRCSFGNLEESFDRIRENVEWDRVPVIHDEMYFEKHRGCQTSQASTKRNNRKSELLARDTEFLSSVALAAGGEYRQEDIFAAWKLILLNQFHDILPGSSIKEVYEDAEIDYATAKNGLLSARDDALAFLCGAKSDDCEQSVTVWNTLGWERDDVATVPVADLPCENVAVLGADGNPVASQHARNENNEPVILFEANDLPAMGGATWRIVKGVLDVKPEGNMVPQATADSLENAFYRIKLDFNGNITSIYDKVNGRDVLEDGAEGNQLALYEDRPAEYDAWDVDFNIDDVRKPVDETVSVTAVESGPVRATVRVVKKTERSTITQNISLWRTLPRIDFATEVDWHEKCHFLKAEFPVAVQSRTATYEIQYGAIERPTHYSDAVDRAKFEVPGHRWIDLSEAGYGVSLLNESKYGFSVHDNVMRISLLRSTTNPDPTADKGRQVFTYSLYPHADSWQKAQTVRRAYELNVPVLAKVTESELLDEIPGSFVSVDAENVVIDTVKKAEDSDALIVRVYESHGARGDVNLTFGVTPKDVTECDLMEENDEPVASCDGSTLSFRIRPWEIRTFKVIL